MKTHALSPGLIHPDALYTLSCLKQQLGISDATLRSARRSGLRVFYKHGRGYVTGEAWIEYVTKPTTTKEPGLPTDSGT